MMIWLITAILCAPSADAAKQRAQSAGELYEQGLRQMRRGYHQKALESFQRVRNYHRDDPVSVKAQLAIADLHFKKGDFEQARFGYEEFAAYHPRHENLDYVTYRIGMSIYRRAPKAAGRDQTATRGAVNVWTSFDTRFPGSAHAEDVDRLLTRSRSRLAAKEMAVADFYVRRKAWGAVRGRTEYLVRRYPDAPQVPEALSLLGSSLHAWGETEVALEVREQLSNADADSRWLVRLDRQLAKPPGVRPDEKIFIRPYRIRGAAPGQPQ